MWEIIDNEIRLIDEESGKITNATHSIITDKMLTFDYWDYLAWAIATADCNDVLSIGHASGAFNQILNNWNMPARGMGFEIDSSYKQINSKYNNINVYYTDFRKGYDLIKSKYDTIVIDVYDNRGYVDDAYDTEWISNFLKLRKNNGKVLFHCIDFTATLLAANITIPSIPSFLISMIKRIRLITKEPIYIVPLWSTYLVWIGPYPKKIHSKLPQIQWVDRFFRSRIRVINEINYDVEMIKKPWSYDVYEFTRLQMIKFLKEMVPKGMEKIHELKKMAEVFDNQQDIHKIDKIITYYKDNRKSRYEFNQIISVLYAMKGDWNNSMNFLEEKEPKSIKWFLV